MSVTADSGKLYLERRAHLEAVDAVSGRQLGDWTVPGLDEKIAWTVVDGAGLFAHEERPAEVAAALRPLLIGDR